MTVVVVETNMLLLHGGGVMEGQFKLMVLLSLWWGCVGVGMHADAQY
jgi:hypothetical protein